MIELANLRMSSYLRSGFLWNESRHARRRLPRHGLPRRAHDIEIAFPAAIKGRADAIIALGSPVLNSHRKQIIELTIKNRLPATYYGSEWVEDGALMSYGVSFTDLHRSAARYVDKILKGAKPADLPVEQPSKFELVINLKTAKQIALIIPSNVLARADRVIR